MNKCYFCGKECGETVLTVNDRTLFQSELFGARPSGCPKVDKWDSKKGVKGNDD